jgi:lipopolysaccharide biosynthesis regulator YciM
LDRAERLLKDLLIEAPDLSSVACRYLLEIYQGEKEWHKAIEVAKGLLPKRSLLKSTAPADKGLVASLSHCCCELAAEALVRNDYLSARSHLKQALGYDRNCVRASLLVADIEYRTGNDARAIKVLQRIRNQDAAFISETVPLLRLIYQRLGNLHGLHNYLLECLQDYPSVGVLLALVDDLKVRQGHEAALSFIVAELKRQPSLPGLGKLVELFTLSAVEGEKDKLLLLQSLIDHLMQNRAQYQCQFCGFSGMQLHWLCPSCKHWGEVKPISSIDGTNSEKDLPHQS